MAHPGGPLDPQKKARSKQRAFDRFLWSCWLPSVLHVIPLATDNLHHHARALIESRVIGCAHVEDSVRSSQILRAFNCRAQCFAEGLRTRLPRFQRDRNGPLQQQASVPRMTAKSRYRTRAISAFI